MVHAEVKDIMRIKSLAVSLVVAALSFTALQAEAAEKLSYEPKVVSLTGTIVPETFPGPPNYSSVAEGDKAEEYWILHLKKAIEVQADKGSDSFNEAEQNVTRIQLIMSDSGKYKTPEAKYKAWKPLIKKGVIVVATGTLSHSNNGHHHTKVLMDVSDLQRKK